MAFEATEVFDFAVDLAKKAGEKIKEGFSADKKVEFKTSAIDLVTQYDKAVEDLLFGSIRKRYPDHKLIGEETTAGSDSGKNSLTDDPTWIIDPIDGTLNFVHGFPYVCVSIGITVNKKPVIGVIYNPILEHMYAAREGAGATLNGEPISVSKSVDLDTSLIFLEIGHYQDKKRQEVTLANFTNFLPKVRGLRCVGAAALQMCLVAQGGADAYCTFGIHCWDMAAGVVIVREAGGVVCDTEGGELDLMSRRFLCAATRELTDKMVAELSQCTALPRDD